MKEKASIAERLNEYYKRLTRRVFRPVNCTLPKEIEGYPCEKIELPKGSSAMVLSIGKWWDQFKVETRTVESDTPLIQCTWLGSCNKTDKDTCAGMNTFTDWSFPSIKELPFVEGFMPELGVRGLKIDTRELPKKLREMRNCEMESCIYHTKAVYDIGKRRFVIPENDPSSH